MPDLISASYVPFTRAEADAGCFNSAVQICPASHFHGDGGSPLAEVGSLRTLYVVAHGHDGCAKVSASASGSGPSLTPDELATRIDQDGLKKGHKSLKLVACKGYQYAVDLKRAMLARGYTSLKVYGYTESVVVMPYEGQTACHKFAVAEDGQNLGRAKKFRKQV